MAAASGAVLKTRVLRTLEGRRGPGTAGSALHPPLLGRRKQRAARHARGQRAPARGPPRPPPCLALNRRAPRQLAPALARCLGLSDGTEVEMRLRRGLPVATEAAVEPASADDWEVVELHAAELE